MCHKLSRVLFAFSQHPTDKMTKTIGWFCPGCGLDHYIPVTGIFDQSDLSPYGWDGVVEKPTVARAIVFGATEWRPRCESYISEGTISYSPTCGHELAGKTIPMADWEAEDAEDGS